MFNIIGDIAGNYKTLMALLDKMPEGTPVSVGDMVDRGPRSKDVVEFFMKNGIALKGNHEDMMVDKVTGGEFCLYNSAFKWNVWMGNGGKETLLSYSDEDGNADIPVDHIEWLTSLPLFFEHEDGFGKFVVTHAPINPLYGLERLKTVPPIAEHSLCWNRGRTKEIPGVLQIHGHNSSRFVQYNNSRDRLDDMPIGTWCINLDTSKAKVLTGINWPTLEIYQQEYID